MKIKLFQSPRSFFRISSVCMLKAKLPNGNVQSTVEVYELMQICCHVLLPNFPDRYIHSLTLHIHLINDTLQSFSNNDTLHSFTDIFHSPKDSIYLGDTCSNCNLFVMNTNQKKTKKQSCLLNNNKSDTKVANCALKDTRGEKEDFLLPPPTPQPLPSTRTQTQVSNTHIHIPLQHTHAHSENSSCHFTNTLSRLAFKT